MKSNNPSKKFYLFLLLPVAFLVSRVLSLFPGFVETYYSRGTFRFTGQVLSTLTGWIPFSLAETIIILIVVYIISSLMKGIMLLFKKRSKFSQLVKNVAANLSALLGIIYFLFIILWGINYYRKPLSNSLGLEIQPSSVEELYGLCSGLIEKANSLRVGLSEDESGVMKLSQSTREEFNLVVKAYVTSAQKYPFLGGSFGQPKGVILSDLMSYTGITGVYFPFTGEANVNYAISDFWIPSTAAHEMAHQRGFAREDEANYIAYMICSLSPDREVKYSGVMLALNYSMNALYEYDLNKYKELTKKYNNGVRRDLITDYEYWEKHEGPVNNISSDINDVYLKSNLQHDGVNSYGRMVDLLLAEQREKNKR